jgi:hypothetical protein
LDGVCRCAWQIAHLTKDGFGEGRKAGRTTGRNQCESKNAAFESRISTMERRIPKDGKKESERRRMHKTEGRI